MMDMDGDDSFTKGLEDIVLSARRVSSSNAYDTGSEQADQLDISKTRTNLVSRFEAEALTQIKFH